VTLRLAAGRVKIKRADWDAEALGFGDLQGHACGYDSVVADVEPKLFAAPEKVQSNVDAELSLHRVILSEKPGAVNMRRDRCVATKRQSSAQFLSYRNVRGHVTAQWAAHEDPHSHRSGSM
jgi:hypothetical protein